MGAPNGSTGTFTMGGSTPNNTATGVLNVNTAMVIGSNSVSGSTVATHGNLIINGGIANMFVDITRTGSATTGNLTLNGGVLDMHGHQIGSAASTITSGVASAIACRPTRTAAAHRPCSLRIPAKACDPRRA